MVGLIIIIAVIIPVSILWVRGIDKMKSEYPNYKGEDFLDWDSTHTEQDI